MPLSVHRHSLWNPLVYGVDLDDSGVRQQPRLHDLGQQPVPQFADLRLQLGLQGQLFRRRGLRLGRLLRGGNVCAQEE